MKKYKNYIYEKNSMSEIFKDYVFRNNISDFDINEMISEMVLHNSTHDETINIIELLLLIGKDKIKLNNDSLYTASNLPLYNNEITLKLIEILIVKGKCDPNELLYINGIYSSTTTLCKMCNSDEKNIMVIIKLILLGGDMSIKDNFGNCGYDYLTTRDVQIIDNNIKNFKYNMDIYKKSDKYNL